MTDNFKLLSDAEHIRKRFSMYGGSQVVQEEVSFINTEFKKVKPDSYKLEYTGLYGDKMSLTGTARQIVMHIMKQQLD